VIVNESYWTRLDQRIDTLNERIDSVNGRLDVMRTRLGRITEHLDTIYSEVRKNNMGHPTSDEDPGSYTAGVGRLNIDDLLRRGMVEALMVYDLTIEERDALANELLVVAKAQGAKLRRERILKNLRRVSVEMSNWDYSINPPFGDWALQIDEGTALIEELSS